MRSLKFFYERSKAAIFSFSSFAAKKTLVVGTASSWSWLKRFFAFVRSQSPFALERYKPSAGSVQSVLKPISGSVEQLKSVADNGEQREVLLQSNRSSVHSFARSSLLRTSEQSTEMRRSALSLAAQVRVPMIKFLGARLPRPRFDPASLPPIPTSSTAASYATPDSQLSSSPPVGKIPRGQSIEEWQLPLRFRRQPISEEECAAINNGGAYGLE